MMALHLVRGGVTIFIIHDSCQTRIRHSKNFFILLSLQFFRAISTSKKFNLSNLLMEKIQHKVTKIGAIVKNPFTFLSPFSTI
jgi:hypothetical protein